MKKASFWIYTIIAIILIVVLWFIIKNMNKKKQNTDSKSKIERKVEACVIKPTLLIDEISVSGSLLAFDEVELRNEVGGRIVTLNLPEGKFVTKGTLLVKLFDDDLQANLQKLQAQLAVKQQIYGRQSELVKVNGISQNDYEQTGLELNTIKADIEAVKAQIRKTEILAPFDGIIGLRNVSIGAEVSPSTLLATIRSNNKLKLDFSVPEKYSPEIQSGMKVKFTMYNDEIQYDATVFATEHGIDAGTRNLKVRAIVDSKSDHLIPGAYANVFLELNENPNALMVPTQAIIPQEDDKDVIVARNAKAHFISVKTGIRKASKIQITEGLQQGDTVITSGILFLKEGSQLFYTNVKTDTL